MLGSFGVGVIVVAGMGCEPPFDDDHIRSVPLTVEAPCDPDGVRLDFETEWVNGDGAYRVISITVSGIDPDCADGEVAIEVDADDPRPGWQQPAQYTVIGSAPVGGSDRTRVPFDRVRVGTDPDGPVRVVAMDVNNEIVTAIRVSITA